MRDLVLNMRISGDREHGFQTIVSRYRPTLPDNLELTISWTNLEPGMPRPRQRVCLQDGLKLDLNQLTRNGFVRPGASGITWTRFYRGEIANGIMSAT